MASTKRRLAPVLPRPTPGLRLQISGKHLFSFERAKKLAVRIRFKDNAWELVEANERLGFVVFIRDHTNLIPETIEIVEVHASVAIAREVLSS